MALMFSNIFQKVSGRKAQVSQRESAGLRSGALAFTACAVLCSPMAYALAPDITSSPTPTTIPAGTTFIYDVLATDPEGDDITFSLETTKPDWLIFTPEWRVTMATLRGIASNADVGSYDITIRASDGTLFEDQSFTLVVTYNPDYDSDGDGMSDGFETQYGFDPADPIDGLLDADGDGLTNAKEAGFGSDPLADDRGPVISVPVEFTVNPYGLYTQVDTSVATAIDGIDGEVEVSSSERLTHYRPGSYSIRWTARDVENNVSEKIQYFHVRPFIEFGGDVQVVEGGTGNVKVVLNGTPPVYPVTASYRVSGTVGAAEHTLVAGTVTINEPDLEASISFEAHQDGVAESVEVVQFTMTDAGNAVVGANDELKVFIHEGNVAPRVRLTATQNAEPVRIVTQSGGVVTVAATISDANADDVHNVSWLGTENALTDTDSEDQDFSFDPTAMDPGVYILRADVCDQLSACGAAEMALAVVASQAALDSSADTDRDGVADDVDGYADSDGDGVPNYLDGLNLGTVLQAAVGNKEGQYQIESSAGSELKLGMVSMMAGNAQARVTMTEAASFGNNRLASADSDYDYNNGLHDFRIESLAADGQSVSVVIPMTATMPANAIYRQLSASGWIDFQQDENNLLASAIGEDGYCPPPGDDRYDIGLTEGDWCLQLTIADGGPNDADGTANSRISNLGGVSSREPVASNKKDDETAVAAFSPFWLLLAGFFLLARGRRFKA